MHRVPTDLVPNLWPAIEPFAKAACRRIPFVCSEDFLRKLLMGHGRLFVSIEAGKVEGFAIVEVLSFVKRKVAHIAVFGGIRGFLSTAETHLFPLLEEWGREQGADTFALHGGPGWLRIARRFEGSHTSTMCAVWRSLDGRKQHSGQDDTD